MDERKSLETQIEKYKASLEESNTHFVWSHVQIGPGQLEKFVKYEWFLKFRMYHAHRLTDRFQTFWFDSDG